MKRKLTQQKAEEIRVEYTTTNHSMTAIARREGVAPSAISQIVNRKAYVEKKGKK